MTNIHIWLIVVKSIYVLWNYILSLKFRNFHLINSLLLRKEFKEGNYSWIWWRNRYEVARVQIKVSARCKFWQFHRSIRDLGNTMKSNRHQDSIFCQYQINSEPIAFNRILSWGELNPDFHLLTCLSGNPKKPSQWTTTRNISWQKALGPGSAVQCVSTAHYHTAHSDTCLGVS